MLSLRESYLKRINLEQEIQLSEIQQALKEMAQNKSPGADGFQVNFYICFFTHIKDLLLEVYQEAIKCKSLHATARDGIITLLPKAGRNPNMIKKLASHYFVEYRL